MEETLTLTESHCEALKRAFPDLTLEEAVDAIKRAELARRYRMQLQRGAVLRLQALKRNPA